jgi:hypothetical protein
MKPCGRLKKGETVTFVAACCWFEISGPKSCPSTGWKNISPIGLESNHLCPVLGKFHHETFTPG